MNKKNLYGGMSIAPHVEPVILMSEQSSNAFRSLNTGGSTGTKEPLESGLESEATVANPTAEEIATETNAAEDVLAKAEKTLIHPDDALRQAEEAEAGNESSEEEEAADVDPEDTETVSEDDAVDELDAEGTGIEVEVETEGEEVEITDISDLSVSQLKDILDYNGTEYPKKAKKSDLIELVKASV